ncbi:winged helix-turn-helix domain-containing protein [Streptomyces sp. NPDC048278]|uniref:helix-turn-helix domain-containing protein n=1 Tax=Streptomyces sp. NPDC048278 TaxID=3155809 RepID=UPI00343A75ED
MPALTDRIKFIRWPAEAGLRTVYRRQGIPCLLVVEGGALPPICTAPSEDWVRAPASREDVEARVHALRQRAYGRRTPTVDSTGVLSFGTRSLTVSSTQAELMELFIAHFEEVVYRSELEQQLARRVPAPTRNALDLHIMRLRRRIAAVGLGIGTAWGRGYLLEPTPLEQAWSEESSPGMTYGSQER